MTVLSVLAPAKINLFLHITGRRADGYHNLQTVFRLIDLYDTLTFQTSDKSIKHHGQAVTLLNAAHITDDANDNLIVKAATALLSYALKHNYVSQATLQTLPQVNINLDKNIPMGAGLGGGSSDCATTLMTLNQLWQLGLNSQQLQEIGTTLGADVPIFIFGHDAIAEGIGDLLTHIKLPPQRFLLLMPQAHIATAALFRHSNLDRDCQIYSIATLTQHYLDFTDQLSAGYTNVFEPVVRSLSVDVNAALNYLTTLSTKTHTTARMTGSGSCVYLPIPLDCPSIQLEQWQKLAPCPSKIVNTLP